MARRYRKIHTGFLIRWLMTNFPAFTFKLNQRVGQPTDEVSKGLRERYKNLAQNWQLVADAIVFLPEKIIIVEALPRPSEWFKIAQLNAYARAFKRTERFKKYWHLPIEKILLTTETNPLMISEASHYNIKVIKWCPPDLEVYRGTLKSFQKHPRGSGLKAPLPSKASS